MTRLVRLHLVQFLLVFDVIVQGNKQHIKYLNLITSAKEVMFHSWHLSVYLFVSNLHKTTGQVFMKILQQVYGIFR